MRLIDKDYAVKIIWENGATRDICGMIENMSEVDAVPVIRCKDCKFNGAFGQCEYLEYVGDYCSRAERKKDETN